MSQNVAENHAPVVEIIKPISNNQFKWNTLIPYSIDIKDVEDGYSAYDEIANQEVIMLTKYLEGPSMMNEYLEHIDNDLKPLFAMSKSTCLTCHAATTKLIGPSFDLIAQKYQKKKNARIYLIDKVIQGGSGIWGEVIMPTHPNLNNQETGELIDWILKQADNPAQFYIGTDGAIRTIELQPNTGKVIYILTAAYQDHGFSDIPNSKKHGTHSIKLLLR